ncbi:hypothetical protein DSO57_1006044 [Entomophthora muscae]|uniref:Uncharacterized protein n=1 Tax=Entomophthora muscae TaxID=34485 RepID=A0ACC2U6A9_9FUNG|nr:hypothetical protein DSO57_1006044 [Entomophthora muscae]
MSSIRNAAHRRNHRERSQPQSRQRFGLLEKKKDYLLRAKDYHKKKDTIKALREKASFRNPDEFYYKMINTRTKARLRNTLLDNDTLKLLRTQDLAYIATQRNQESKRIEKLRAELHFIGATDETKKDLDDDMDIEAEETLVKSKHTIFVDDEEEVQNFDPVEHFETVPELVNQTHNRLKKSTLASVELASRKLSKKEKKKLLTGRKELYKELKERLDRLAKLEKAEREVQIQRALMVIFY